MMANVNLSQRDIDYIARVVDTEVPRSLANRNPAEYQRMVNAVVDTVTNRMASGQFPSTVTGVVNQPSQFSKINGPASLSPYGSVQAAPQANPQTRALVDDHIASRVQGMQPEIGGALNYANPNFSSRSAINGWIDPMINAGATMLGIGQNVHYHGTAPGSTPVGQYGLTAEGMPSGLIGTPQARPEPVNNALLGYQPTDVQRTDISAPISAFDNERFSSAPASPQAFDAGRFGPQPSAAPQSFDMGRFGPSPVNTQTLAATSPQPQSFDMGRFGPEVTSPTPSFDPGRFGTPTAPAQGVDGLRRGLLDQQLDAGILPSTEYERLAQERKAVPGYVDPQVSARPAGTLLSDATVQAPSRVSNGLLSPEAAAIQSAGGIVQARQPNYAIAAQLDKELGNRRLSGGLLGGLAGGVLLGPLGAAVGGLLGRNYAQDTYFPSAPAPIAGRIDSPGYGYGRGGGSGYGSLSDYGRDVYSGSDQFSGAVDRGDVGLW